MTAESGSFEIFDDGDAIDLKELYDESVLLKSLKNVCEFTIRTRKAKLGLFSEQLNRNGELTKCEADRVYRNVVIINDLYRNRSLRSKIALEGLQMFEVKLRAVIVENCTIDWKYACSDSKSSFTIAMKTKHGRVVALFKGKYQFIFEAHIDGIETLVTASKGIFKFDPIILVKGLPCEEDESIVIKFRHDFSKKKVFYANFPEIIESAKKKIVPNYVVEVKKEFKKGGIIKGAAEGKIDLLKGSRESLGYFKIDESDGHVVKHAGEQREFLKELAVIGQFDNKAIMTKRIRGSFTEIWMFDQHACAERINLEALINSNLNLSRDEMNMKACRSAVKFGDRLDFSKQKEIVDNLQNCQEPFHCAHGRPTCWLLAKLHH